MGKACTGRSLRCPSGTSTAAGMVCRGGQRSPRAWWSGLRLLSFGASTMESVRVEFTSIWITPELLEPLGILEGLKEQHE